MEMAGTTSFRFEVKTMGFPLQACFQLVSRFQEIQAFLVTILFENKAIVIGVLRGS